MFNRHTSLWLAAALLLCVLLGAVEAVDLEKASSTPPPPPPEGIGAGRLFAVLGLGMILSTLFVPLCLVAFILVVLLLLKLLRLVRVQPTAIVGFLIRRVMGGGLKTLLWQIWIVLALPAAWLGTGLAARITGAKLGIENHAIFAIAITIAAAAIFVAISGVVAAGVKGRLGGMNPLGRMGMKQAQPPRGKRRR